MRGKHREAVGNKGYGTASCTYSQEQRFDLTRDRGEIARGTSATKVRRDRAMQMRVCACS
jgi:hypothetical protein